MKKGRGLRCLLEQKMADRDKEFEDEREKYGLISEEIEDLKKQNAELRSDVEKREKESIEMMSKFGEMEGKIMEARKDHDEYGKSMEEREAEVESLRSAAGKLQKEVRIIEKWEMSDSVLECA